MRVIDNADFKAVRSENYNYDFRKSDGFFKRWGRTEADDPQLAPAAEIMDLEISTGCHQMCSFCYKGNSPRGENMSFETFKTIFDKLCWPGTTIPFITQVAFGITDIDANESMWQMFAYCRERGVIPNVTINGSRMTPEYFDLLVKYCGAVAVSHYDDDRCFNAVKELTDRGLKQVNIHQLLAVETLDQCHAVIESKANDPRLERLKAIVFLTLKPKGERNTYHNISSRSDYVNLVKHAIERKVNFGFDSCFAPIFADIAKDLYAEPELSQVLQACEPCESSLFSIYCDVRGDFVPCSFCPDQAGIEPISMLTAENFFKDVWQHPKTVEFRKKLLTGCRNCPVFPTIYDYK